MPEPADCCPPRSDRKAGWNVLLLTDSLAFHGPGMGELTTEPRLWPNVLASALSTPDQPCRVTIFGRRGWTARDACSP